MSQKLNELLKRHVMANGGTNHCPDYVLCNLPTADSLRGALERYFAQFRTGKITQPAEAWNIRTIAIEKPDDRLFDVTQFWFFGSEYSPNVLPPVAVNEVLDFVINLRSVVGDAPMFEVKVTPPRGLWYDCFWEDFAFDGQAQRWLLHLGFSD